MADDSPTHPPRQPADGAMQEADQPARKDGRCDQCGYVLVGLPMQGVCPECGSPYTDASARRLQPWPSAGAMCARLGWPLLGLAAVTAAGSAAGNDPSVIVFLIAGWGFALAVPINSYFQVRAMLKKCLPEQKRTRGPVFAMRAIGTTICVVAFILLIAPLVFLVGCLIMLSNSNFH